MTGATPAAMPARGVAAHRGGPAHAPENTLAALRNAVRRGVHQVEFDVRRCASGEVVVMHDETVDRTTDGTGAVRDLSLAQLRALDAGRGFSPAFEGERVPTLEEALDALPRDVWINVQIKRAEPVAAAAVAIAREQDRLHQVVLACGNAAGREARGASPDVLLCNLVRRRERADYIDHATNEGSDFVQFHHLLGPPRPDEIARARAAGLRINHFCAPDVTADAIAALFDVGVDFALVDDLDIAVPIAQVRGLAPPR